MPTKTQLGGVYTRNSRLSLVRQVQQSNVKIHIETEFSVYVTDAAALPRPSFRAFFQPALYLLTLFLTSLPAQHANNNPCPPVCNDARSKTTSPSRKPTSSTTSRPSFSALRRCRSATSSSRGSRGPTWTSRRRSACSPTPLREEERHEHSAAPTAAIGGRATATTVPDGLDQRRRAVPLERPASEAAAGGVEKGQK